MYGIMHALPYIEMFLTFNKKKKEKKKKNDEMTCKVVAWDGMGMGMMYDGWVACYVEIDGKRATLLRENA